MKKTIITIATAIMFTTTFSAFANTTNNPSEDVSSNRAVATYVEIITSGSSDHNLFAEDFEYQTSTNPTKYTKKQYTKFLESNKGVKYDCTTTYTILDETGNSGVAKATMEFENFTRVDHITLIRDNDNWKISKVVTTYP